ncbi:SIMPL domain-containing protein [Rhizobium sp. CSW-27]|uniref:SIMPL domain-containing protein n=1 Tax=Rhizobium sp. CSW-27 TaxID=2839985 RepID=UPI0020789FF7|nr:SIMPL domain-containing protein [Rhizobium sp. CSW-27]
MMKNLQRPKGVALAILVAASLAAPVAALAQMPPPPPAQPPAVSVMGEGKATVAPDMAVVSLVVTRMADTADAALAASNAAMRDVLAALKEEGIAERDMQTSDFSIYPRYSQPDRNGNTDETPPKIVGYQVANGLTVRVRDLKKLGSLLDRSVKLGVNQGGEISFGNDDPKAALAEARRRAVQDAMDKARTLVEAAGARLGPVLSIEESPNMPPAPMPMMRMAMAKEADAVPIASGENTYAISVNMRFEIAR